MTASRAVQCIVVLWNHTSCATVCATGCVGQDTCGSTAYMGLNIYKQTNNLSESEQRMTSGWDGFKDGQTFVVPLHDGNNVTTGLVRVRSHLASAVLDPAWHAHISTPQPNPISTIVGVCACVHVCNRGTVITGAGTTRQNAPSDR